MRAGVGADVLPALLRLVSARGVVHGGVDGLLDDTVSALGTSLIVLVASLHLWFLVLEMFLWTRPAGMKIFRTTPDFARQSRALAANQGLYNGFLAAGLAWGALHPTPAVAVALQVFFLGCVVMAGVFGALTVSKRIFLVQALPALVGLGLVWLTARP